MGEINLMLVSLRLQRHPTRATTVTVGAVCRLEERWWIVFRSWSLLRASVARTARCFLGSSILTLIAFHNTNQKTLEIFSRSQNTKDTKPPLVESIGLLTLPSRIIGWDSGSPGAALTKILPRSSLLIDGWNVLLLRYHELDPYSRFPTLEMTGRNLGSTPDRPPAMHALASSLPFKWTGEVPSGRPTHVTRPCYVRSYNREK